jgi:hypothetical protein
VACRQKYSAKLKNESQFAAPWIRRGEPEAGVLPISIGSAMVLLREEKMGVMDPGLIYLYGD